MDLATFETRVRSALAAARESLGRIEEEVRERGDDRGLLGASRCYAQLCLHAREYLTHAAVGDPRPRRFAQLVAPLHRDLGPFAPAIERLGLHPTGAELEALVADADAVPPRR